MRQLLIHFIYIDNITSQTHHTLYRMYHIMPCITYNTIPNIQYTTLQYTTISSPIITPSLISFTLLSTPPSDEAHGWTVTLHCEGEIYECAGYQMIMDLVGEIERCPATSHQRQQQQRSRRHSNYSATSSSSTTAATAVNDDKRLSVTSAPPTPPNR